MYKLLYSQASPFVRKVLVFAHEAGLGDRVVKVPTNPWESVAGITPDNPLGKIPAMMTPDGTFTGSFACCDYLDQQHSGNALIPRRGPERWRVMQLHGLADGAIESGVGFANETLRRPKDFQFSGHIDRQIAKINSALSVLDNHAGELASVDLASITTGCLLGYLDFRLAHIEWRKTAPKLAAWFEVFGARTSMAGTMPPK